MANYNFKKFFNTNRIFNEEYVSNGHFIIKRLALTKTQNNYINTFENKDNRIDNVIRTYNMSIEKEYKYDSIEFKPESITEIHSTDEDYMTLINENNIVIKEEYYNFIISIKCRAFYVEDIKLCYIYNSDNEIIGIVMPVRVLPDDISRSTNYSEYIALQKTKREEKKDSKQNMKKCLYISDNKAIVRNKELTCIANLVNDETYKNLYIESDYTKDFGEVFINFGFVFMGMGRTISKNDDAEHIKQCTEHLSTITLEAYKNYIEKCFNNNQFINVAEIKLMELAGESQEYIQTLTDHRQKVLDLRERERNEKEQKREQEQKNYVDKENNKAIDIIWNAEQAIINKGKIKNVDVTLYKSRYDSNTSSLILHLMKFYNINVPLKTQGWINKALADVFYNNDNECWSYQYYTSSKNSEVFSEYLDKLITAIYKKYEAIITKKKIDPEVERLFNKVGN